MTFDLVLARMEEPVDWVVEVPPQVRVFCYCFKDKPVSTPRPMTCLNIVDAGQESGAYIAHIVNHFDCLADVTVFSQADPHPHVNGNKSFIQILKCLVESPQTGFHFIGDRCLSGSGDPLVKRVHIHHAKNPAMSYSATPIKDACKYLLDHDCPDQFEIPFGAIFSVDRSTIRKHSLEFWHKLHTWNCHAPKTFEAALLERLWPLILK